MSVNPLIKKITESQLRNDIPEFRAGDTVRVHARIVEGKRERIQIFEGVVIKRRGEGISETYTVRKISNGVGVERTFRFIRHVLTRLKSYVWAVFVVQSFTTCVHFAARLLVFQNVASNYAKGLRIFRNSFYFCLTKQENLLLY